MTCEVMIYKMIRLGCGAESWLIKVRWKENLLRTYFLTAMSQMPLKSMMAKSEHILYWLKLIPAMLQEWLPNAVRGIYCYYCRENKNLHLTKQRCNEIYKSMRVGSLFFQNMITDCWKLLWFFGSHPFALPISLGKQIIINCMRTWTSPPLPIPLQSSPWHLKLIDIKAGCLPVQNFWSIWDCMQNDCEFVIMHFSPVESIHRFHCL